MQSFAKIYNDVFVLEKPVSVQKYFLTEVQVVEMTESLDGLSNRLQTPFRYNFCLGTSKYVDYYASREFVNFLKKAVATVKNCDINLGETVDLHKRGRKAQNKESHAIN